MSLPTVVMNHRPLPKTAPASPAARKVSTRPASAPPAPTRAPRPAQTAADSVDRGTPRGIIRRHRPRPRRSAPAQSAAQTAPRPPATRQVAHPPPPQDPPDGHSSRPKTLVDCNRWPRCLDTAPSVTSIFKPHPSAQKASFVMSKKHEIHKMPCSAWPGVFTRASTRGPEPIIATFGAHTARLLDFAWPGLFGEGVSMGGQARFSPSDHFQTPLLAANGAVCHFHLVDGWPLQGPKTPGG